MGSLRLRSQVLRDELDRGGTLSSLLQRHTKVVMVTMAQLILCNRIHRLDQGAARRLLQVDDRAEEKPVRGDPGLPCPDDQRSATGALRRDPAVQGRRASSPTHADRSAR